MRNDLMKLSDLIPGRTQAASIPTDAERAPRETRFKATRTPRVLIVGISDPENQFVRAVEGYGFEAVHYADDKYRSNMPMDCDAVIVVVSHVSHNAFYEAKDRYRAAGKRVFIARQGFSDVKTAFEDYFLSGVREKLANSKDQIKLWYCLCHFMKYTGNRMKTSEFRYHVSKLFPEIGEDAFRIFGISAGVCSVVSVRRGLWEFRGLSTTTFNKLKALDLPIKAEWHIDVTRAKEQAKLDKITAAQEQLQPAMPEVAPEEEDPVVEAAPQRLSANDELALLTQAVSELDKKFMGMTNREEIQNQIVANFSRMSTAKLNAFLELTRS